MCRIGAAPVTATRVSNRQVSPQVTLRAHSVFLRTLKKHQAGRNTPSLHPKSFEGEILSEWIKVMLFINFSSVLKLRVLKKKDR